MTCMDEIRSVSRSLTGRWATGAGVVLCAAVLACGAPPRDLDAAVYHGLACVAGSYDGRAFADDYLRFVYPGEHLSSPLPDRRITYRILDAYFIVLMLRQAGAEPGPATALFEDAERLTAALVPAWRAQGVYNLRKDPAPDGIALDTYAILAYLRRDGAMARTILAGLDRDGWLPANLYVGPESFRLLADESWAARALVVTGVAPDRAGPIVRRIADDALDDLDRGGDPGTRANIALHALEALDDLRPMGIRGPDPSDEDARAALLAELWRLREDPRLAGDTLTLANLTATLVLASPDACRDLAPSIDALLRRQETDGCWSVDASRSDPSGRVFATLRILLTLVRYQACAGSGKTS